MKLMTMNFEIIIRLARDTREPESTVGWKAQIGQTLYGRYMAIAAEPLPWEIGKAVTSVVADMIEMLSAPDDLLVLQLQEGIEPSRFVPSKDNQRGQLQA